MVLARPSGRGFPAAIVALTLTGLLSFRSALLVPTTTPALAVLPLSGRPEDARQALRDLSPRAEG